MGTPVQVGSGRGRPSVRPVCSEFPSGLYAFSPYFPLLLHGLAAVAAMAKAFQIVTGREEIPVSLVIPDVVHIGGPHPPSVLGALPTPWLLQELSGAQVIRPDTQAVPAVPGHAFSAHWC